jgi:sporulation protein YlmC with PRC-barrel domain
MDDAGKIYDVALHLLDRQIIDPDGRFAGKVDDLELTFPASGEGAPYVSAILSGPGALSRRIGGRLGGWIESVHERLHPHEQPGPARVPFGLVKRIATSVEVSLPERELEVDLFQRWTRDRIIAKIPGADRATE